MGVRAGDRVGVALDRSPELLVALLAVMKAGAAYVPFDPEFPRERVEFMLKDAEAALLLTSGKYAGYFTGARGEALLEDLPVYDTGDLEWETGTDALAYILYTSGSTGKPKGVMVEHHSLVNLLYSLTVLPGVDASDKVLALTTVTFDIAAVELFLPLLTGAQIVMASRETARDGRALLDLVRAEGVTLMQGTPATWKMMVNAGWNERLPIRVISCGEALPRLLADQLLARSLVCYNMYGPTETTVYSTGRQILAGRERITIGWPVMNTGVYILDGSLKPVPEGEVGEICIGGAGVARGYIGQDALTAEKFVDNPFVAGSKMYRTGDIGLRGPDGDIAFLGRHDDQVKVRGYRIELGEVEHHLLRLEGIRDAVVLTREERPGELQLIAYVATGERVLSKGQVAAWKQELRKSLPPYMVPPLYVPVAKIPVTPSGKVDRKALLLTPRGSAVDGQGKPPRTNLEKLVAEVWGMVLGLDEVDIEDDFFELGGHSLIAVEMMTILEERTGTRLPMASLFEAPTVEKLSRLLDSGEQLSWGSLVPIKPSGTKRPLYIVHGMGLTVMVFHALAQQMDPEQPVYGIQARGLNGEEEPLHTIEEIATSYVEEILAHNPHGPYCLAGYSLGGIIVFEMARQLRAMGKDIKLLAAFDTYAGDTHPSDRRLTKVLHKIRRQPVKLRFILRAFLKDPREALHYQLFIAGKRIRPVLQRAGILRKQEKRKETMGIPEKVAEALEEARANYHLRVNEADILELFRVKKRIYFIYDPVYLGWKPFVKKGIRITEISGDHKTFLQPPHDLEVATALQRLLDQV
jgi:amino acid adenylation domain-containing protein